MTCNPDFAEFLVEELVPWVRRHYPVTTDPAHTVVGGISLGGLTAAYAGWRHPEIFGKILSQSGSYQFAPEGDVEAEWLTHQFATNPRQPLSFYLEAGLFEAWTPEGYYGPGLLLANRHFRDILLAKEYPVHYAEFTGAHVFVCWQGTFADGLLALIGS